MRLDAGGRIGRRVRQFATIAIAVTASGCSYYHDYFPNFVEKLRRRPECVASAQVPKGKVDFCMTDSNGHRRDFNACISAQGVPDFKIERLDACVEASTPPAHY
ncbi:MAG TPA: hypothetical protein VKS22_01055 [Candidatus Binataceae bacterium]|nr:hypothetical protein [Candidatus Binataceae bacterium]